MARLLLISAVSTFVAAGFVYGDDKPASKNEKATIRARDPEPGIALRLPVPEATSKSSPEDRIEFENRKTENRIKLTQSPFAIVRRETAIYGVLNVEFDNAESCRQFHFPGVNILCRYDRFADIYIPNSQVWDAVEMAPGVVWTELADVPMASPPLVGSSSASNAAPEDIVRGGYHGLKGNGVIVAILDTGVDFHNPDFIRYGRDGQPTSRLLYYWDTLGEFGSEFGSKGPVSYPNGAPVGILYSRDDLTADLRRVSPRIAVWDTNGHGTACMGIAAGNGNNSKNRYLGVAPEADLIAVRIGEGKVFENAYLLGSICAWLDRVAANRPLVVSCSFGAHSGGHDGYRVEERQLDARFSADRKGRVLCAAGGNEGMLPLHASIHFCGEADKGFLKWKSDLGGNLRIYLETDAHQDIRLVSAGKARIKHGGYTNGLTKNYIVTIDFSEGPGELQLYNISNQPMKGDAYIAGYGTYASFDESCAVFGKQIISPGASANALTVGSYDFDDRFDHYGKLDAVGKKTRSGEIAPLIPGSLSNYSNLGPLRIGNIVKPDLVAPGRYFTTSASRNTSAMRDTSGRHQLFHGTSAATPYAAGIIALIMERKPDITSAEIKELIRRHATSDSNTDKVPNPSWGYGKLNLQAIQEMIKGLPERSHGSRTRVGKAN